jgi:hypothetical protein
VGRFQTEGSGSELFTYTTEFEGEEVDIVLRPFGEMPGRISRLHRGDVETQMWEAFEWGLKDSKQLAIIDEMPMSEITDMLSQWQMAAGTDLGKSPRSSTTSRTKRTVSRSKPI